MSHEIACCARLDDLALRKPDVAAALKEQIGEFENAAMKAVEQYTDDQRVLGNTFLAQARQHSVVINDRLSALVDDLNHEVVRARDQVVADITQATQIAYVLVVVAILFGIATNSRGSSLHPGAVAPGHFCDGRDYGRRPEYSDPASVRR